MNVGRRDGDGHRQAKGINCCVPFATFDVLATIVSPNATHLAGANSLAIDDHNRWVGFSTGGFSCLKIQTAMQTPTVSKCSQTAYSACLHDAGPCCRKDAASEPVATRAVEHTACVSRDIKAPAERFIATDDVRSDNYDGSGFGSSSKSGSWRNARRCSTTFSTIYSVLRSMHQDLS